MRAGNNNLTGPIPNQISPASRLQVLTLYNNQLTGTIPASIGNAQQLSNIDITNNAIFGTIPASLGNITTLKYAILKFNKLSGALRHNSLVVDLLPACKLLDYQPCHGSMAASECAGD